VQQDVRSGSTACIPLLKYGDLRSQQMNRKIAVLWDVTPYSLEMFIDVSEEQNVSIIRT
jgi:hypothetical protein